MKKHFTSAISAVVISLTIAEKSIAAEPVIVTATRSAQTADETLAPVTVITREDIEQSPAQDLRELLVGTPGFDASGNGAYGKTTAFFLRGTNSDHVLTLVDGIKLYSATLGATAFQFIPLDQIERVEIVRGPRAALYGSEAIGGVIQIFTRKGGDKTVADVSIGGGSDSSGELNAGIGGTNGDTRYSIRGGAFKTDGIDVTQGNQLDDDGYDNASVTASLQHSISDDTAIDLNVLRAQGNTEFDNPFDPLDIQNEEDFVQQAANSRLSLSPSDIWSLVLQLGQSRDELEDITDGGFNSEFNTKRNELSWQNDFEIDDIHLLTVGVDYSDDKVSGSVDFDEEARDNTGIFAQWQGDYGRHSVVLGLRNDDNEQFGSQSTGSFDYGIDLNDDIRFNFGFGTAFKAPSFNQLYFPDFGNPSLQTEESESVELGLSGDVNNGQWSVRVFDSSIDDLIVTNLSTFLPENVAEAEIKGLEAEYATNIRDWNMSAGLTLLDPEDKATGN
ncbi:MAG: TonB-dependent receptor, partial [Gammaproteobacteria bacterium]|nr:TonB-dependent receptor [Gammaproteobacteria bacterium]